MDSNLEKQATETRKSDGGTYLILAHQMTAHLLRLVTALKSSNRPVVIHVDARRNIDEFTDVLAMSHVFPVHQRVTVRWGGFSMVEATLAGLHTVDGLGYPGHVVLCSGSDYPLVNPERMSAHLSSHATVNFINSTPMGGPSPSKPMSRVRSFYVPYDRVPRWRSVVPRLVNAIQLPRHNGRLLDKYQLHGGSQWWALNEVTWKSLLADEHLLAELTRLFRWSQYPDEAFFQTAVANLHQPVADSVVPSITFSDWSRPSGPKPAVIDALHLRSWSDFGQVTGDLGYGHTRFLLARKFPSNSAALTSEIEERLWHSDE